MRASRIRLGASVSPRASRSWESGASHPSKRWKCWDGCSGKARPRSWRCRSTGSSIASFIRRALNHRCSLNLHVRKPSLPLQADHHGRKEGPDPRALLTAQPAERHQLLQSYLSEQVARVLGLSASKLDVQQPLSNLGLDSLMAVELKNRIAVDLGVNVPMVKFLQGPSVEQAAAQLLDQLTAGVSDAPAALAPAVTQRNGEQENGRVNEHLLANLDQLSDEEVNSLLTDTTG